jgi:hypothetical protein
MNELAQLTDGTALETQDDTATGGFFKTGSNNAKIFFDRRSERLDAIGGHSRLYLKMIFCLATGPVAARRASLNNADETLWHKKEY